MKRWYLLAFLAGLALACPLSGQRPVVRPELKAIADSMIPPAPLIQTNGTPSTQLRNRLAARLDSLARVPVDTVVVVDTIIIHVPQDTLVIPIPPDTVPVPPIDTVPEPPTDSTWSVVWRDTTHVGNLRCPMFSKCLIGPNVSVAGNVLVESAVLGMRPGSSLRIIGMDPNACPGGGLHYFPELDACRGVWVWGSGQLDIRGTPKVAWNRTGTDPSWSAQDEYWIAPTAVGDFAARRWFPGQPVPKVGTNVPATEVLNVTRDVVIQGPGHIHINSTKPQRVEYVQLRALGISNSASGGPVLGRYALHLHMSGDGVRGSVVRGVAAVDSRGTVFVPHASHGVTFTDVVSVNSSGPCEWWDMGHETNDLLIDRMACVGIPTPDVTGMFLGCGTNMEIRNSVVAGVRGGYTTPGFDWPEPTTPFQSCVSRLVWKFDTNNVVHNNRGPGIRFWTNNQDEHNVSNYTSYRNGIAGIENGAYFSATQYHGIVSFEDGYLTFAGEQADAAGFFNNASATVNRLGVMQLTDCNITAKDGPALKVGHRQLAATHYFLIQDCTFTAGPGHPKVWVHIGSNPWLAHFVGTNVEPADILFENVPGNEGSEILIDSADGRKWRVTFTNGQKRVEQL